jgi:hypothetical protein
VGVFQVVQNRLHQDVFVSRNRSTNHVQTLIYLPQASPTRRLEHPRNKPIDMARCLVLAGLALAGLMKGIRSDRERLWNQRDGDQIPLLRWSAIDQASYHVLTRRFIVISHTERNTKTLGQKNVSNREKKKDTTNFRLT